MKVLQINSVCGYGSTGRIAVEICESLKHNGHDCLIAFGRGSAPQGINSLRIGSDFGVNMHGVLSRVTDRHGFYSKVATRKLLKQAEAFNPDVIHLHNIHGYYINIKMLFEWLVKINKPVVWTLHDCWAFTGHCSYFDNVECEKWKTGCYSCPQKGQYPASMFTDASEANYRSKQKLFVSINKMVIVTPSEWLARLVGESFLNKHTVKVINNGVDLDIFKPNEGDRFRKVNGIEDYFVILGVASNWEERKGLRFFIELSKLIDNETRIVLVGLSAKQLKGLPQNFIGIKRTNSAKELAEIYSASSVFVNPTLEDNFPTTNLEALACGTPVVTFDTGGSSESLDETIGFTVEPGNLKELYDKIMRIKENGKSIYSESCVKRVKRLYNKDDKYKEYIDCYHSLI